MAQGVKYRQSHLSHRPRREYEIDPAILLLVVAVVALLVDSC